MRSKHKDVVLVPPVGPLPGGPAAAPGIRPPDERKPGTREKGTPNDVGAAKAKPSRTNRRAPPPHAPHRIDQNEKP